MRSVVIAAAAVILCALGLAAPPLAKRAAVAEPAAGAEAGWTPIGPYGGRISGLVRCPAAPNVMYAATKSGYGLVFRSNDSGASWTRKAAADDYIYDIAVHPTNPAVVYALGYEEFLKSVDGGATFKAYPYPKGISGAAGALAAHPSNPDILYATGKARLKPSGERLAVLKSANGGTTWTAMTLDAAADWVNFPGLAVCAASPETVYASGYVHRNGGDYGRIYKSTNGGTTWTNVTSAQFQEDHNLRSVAVDPRDPKRAYVTSVDGVARTTDGGTSWTLQTTPDDFYPTAVAVDPANSKALYAQTISWGDNPGFYKSQDGGLTWTRTTKGVFGIGVRILASGRTVWLGSSAGIFRSNSGGAAFAPAQKGLAASWVDDCDLVASSPSTLFAYVSQYGAMRTKTRGTSWLKGPLFKDIDGVADVLAHPSNPLKSYILTWGYGEDDLFRSTDGGKTFKSLFRKDVEALAGDPSDGDRLALAGRVYNSDWRSEPSYFGIYLSEDGGATWRPIKIRTDDGSEARAVAFAASDRKVLHVVGSTAERKPVLYRSADGGASWRRLKGPFEADYLVYAIAVDPTSPSVVYVSSSGGVYRSLNGGAAWAKINYWGGVTLAVNPLKPAEVFIGGPNGIQFSADRGAHWTDITGDLAAPDIAGIVLDPAARIVYVATRGAGVCKRKF